MSKSGLVDAPGRMTRARREEPRAQRGDGRHGARPGRRARHRLDDVHAGVQPVAFVAAEEERLVLHDRAADRSAELILLQRRLGQVGDDAAVDVALRVEVVRRVELVAAQVLEDASRGTLLPPDFVMTLT